MNIGKKYGFSNEMAWLKEILSLPVQMKDLHGIEEIKTPLFKILTRTYYPTPKKICDKGDISPVMNEHKLI